MRTNQTDTNYSHKYYTYMRASQAHDTDSLATLARSARCARGIRCAHGDGAEEEEPADP